MWIAERFMPAGAYTTSIDTRGRLDAAVLERTLNEIVRRHEILRTTFDSDAPVQTVHEPSSVELAFRDLRALPESTRDDRNEGAGHAAAGDGGDLATDEWLRQNVPPHHG